MTTLVKIKNIQDDVMTIGLLYKADIVSASGRVVNFRFPSGDDKLNFQSHLREINVKGIKIVKSDHGLSLGVEFITI